MDRTVELIAPLKFLAGKSQVIPLPCCCPRLNIIITSYDAARFMMTQWTQARPD